MAKHTKEEKEDAANRLREWVKPGDKVYCILRKRANSGMSRWIGFVVFKDNRAVHLNYLMAKLLDRRMNDDGDGLFVSGCGMDMGFSVVYNLAATLYPTKSDKPESHRDSTGGYSLTHEWL